MPESARPSIQLEEPSESPKPLRRLEMKALPATVMVARQTVLTPVTGEQKQHRVLENQGIPSYKPLLGDISLPMSKNNTEYWKTRGYQLTSPY